MTLLGINASGAGVPLTLAQFEQVLPVLLLAVVVAYGIRKIIDLLQATATRR